MNTILQFSSQPKQRKVYTWLLAFSWIAGMFLGAASVSFAGDSTLQMMRTACINRVSISGLLIVSVLPFLLSASAVFFFQPWLLIPICFIKAFSFSFCSGGAVLAFGSSAWLILNLLLFSDTCLIPLQCWFSFRLLYGRCRQLRIDTIICVSAALIIGLVDHNIVSPFLAILIDY